MAGKWPQLWAAGNDGPLDCRRGWLTFPGNPETVGWRLASSRLANGLARRGPEGWNPSQPLSPDAAPCALASVSGYSAHVLHIDPERCHAGLRTEAALEMLGA